jgi:predicted protein tyrosine phosphatase
MLATIKDFLIVQVTVAKFAIVQATGEFFAQVQRITKRITMALETVIFMGRIEAETELAKPDWVVISLSEWGVEPAKLKEGWHSILRLEFHDIDEPQEPYDLFNEDQARRIIQFVEAHAGNSQGILVHCRAGISRSAAVAKWIAEQYGLPFNEQYSLYNKHVYRVLRQAGHQRISFAGSKGWSKG